MYVIIEHAKDANLYLRHYTNKIVFQEKNFKILDIKAKHLPYLEKIATAIEPNFIIELCKEEEILALNTVHSTDMILATISGSKHMQEADYFYHMTRHTYSPAFHNITDKKCIWISCSCKQNKITAADFIKCIASLKKLAIKLQKPILIYVNSYIPDEKFRYRSLTNKIINHYLDGINGGMIEKCQLEDPSKYYSPASGSYEFYSNQVLYLKTGLMHTLSIFMSSLNSVGKDKDWFQKIYSEYRQTSSLFPNDFFYNSISADEEIYVFLDAGNYREPGYYEALGLKTVPLMGGYGMLYARRSQFDTLSNVLRADVTPRHRMPILSHMPCTKEQIYPSVSYSVTAEDLIYKGRGVYIGLITTDDVDYTNEVLRYQDGRTRIAYLWQQTRADEGVQYFKEQIDTALMSPNPGEIIPLPQEDSMSTMMLGIAGGQSLGDTYRGIATEAEFVVAKLKPVSAALQKIYGGSPSRYGVLLQDVMVAVIELTNFAINRGVPIVLCMPFNTNIDPHDGSLILYQILVMIARRAGVTVIIPTGEEADKQHHHGIWQIGEPLAPVTIRVPMPNQTMVGVIYQRYGPILTARLYPPLEAGRVPVNLTQSGITQVADSTVYTNGEIIDFLNGARRILFRIENARVGEWRLESILETGALSQINLWIAQQELNPYITLVPSSPFTTLGSSACIDYAMVVGGYDQELGIVLRSSGRGYTWDERVKPILITSSKNIIAPCGRGEWVSITGTLTAASIMTGVVAAMYSRFIAEGIVPLPNSLGITNILFNVLQQFQGVVYPNPNAGYGIFNLQILNTLLRSPL